MGNALDVNYNVSHCAGEGNRRAEAFFDAGTLVEIGAHVRRSTDSAEWEGVVTGYGAVDGKLVFAFFQDNSRMKGALDGRYTRKIEQIYALAVQNRAPIVGVLDSAGASIYDGASSMAAYGAWMKASAKASGVIPRIAVIDGICAGSAAVVAAMADFVVTVEDRAEVYLRPTAEETVPASVSGLSALRAPDEAAAFAAVRRLVKLLPAHSKEDCALGTAFDASTACGVWNPDDALASLRSLSDDGTVLLLWEDYGKGLLTAFMPIAGAVTAVIASDPAVHVGAIGAEEAKKAAKLISFADAFGIPVVTLVDSVGASDEDSPELTSALARLASAYASATCPMVTVVCGKAYGLGFTLLGAKSLGADIVFALPEASIGLLSPESAVAFVWNSRIDETVSREMLEAEWREAYASPAEAACRGEIDDVIKACELRLRVGAAVSMLLYKNGEAPFRRHAVAPL